MDNQSQDIVISSPLKSNPEPKRFYHKTNLALKIMQTGETAEEALKLTNGKEKICERSVYKLKERFKKYSLTQPSIVKSANFQVKRILKSEPRESIKYHMDGDKKVVDSVQEILPSDTNILSAATMVYDRYEPLIQRSININASLDIHPVDLSNYLDVGPVRAAGP